MSLIRIVGLLRVEYHDSFATSVLIHFMATPGVPYFFHTSSEFSSAYNEAFWEHRRPRFSLKPFYWPEPEAFGNDDTDTHVRFLIKYYQLRRGAPLSWPFSGSKHTASVSTTSGECKMANELWKLLTLLSSNVKMSGRNLILSGPNTRIL